MSCLTFLWAVFFMTGAVLFSAFGIAAISVIAFSFGFLWSGRLLLSALLKLDDENL